MNLGTRNNSSAQPLVNFAPLRCWSSIVISTVPKTLTCICGARGGAGGGSLKFKAKRPERMRGIELKTDPPGIYKRIQLEKEIKKYIKNPTIRKVNNTYEINVGQHLIFHTIPDNCEFRYNPNGDLIIFYINNEKIINIIKIYETLKYIYNEYNKKFD
jgi:hypothetical protein